MKDFSAEIGVIGGTGLYSLLDDVVEKMVDTPYGAPSDSIAVGTVRGRRVAFLPRHGKHHQYPPHVINYRANLWALKELGVTAVLSPCAVGSLKPEIRPGDFVICDQFVDRTTGRKDTFYDGPVTTHVSTADPYCPVLREVAVSVCKREGVPFHDKGTIVVIQGPRFSTRAESRWFNRMGWDVINMTQYPEVVLAREIGLCFVNISLVTDYDVGLEGRDDILPVTHEEVVRVFKENTERLRSLIFSVIEQIPAKRACRCRELPKEGRLET
ncbi:MAG TPA: S-methyl-5'-thioadenosine phosphorylase [Clostridia bacterium]|nr:S-methyl-5'-thioadenosine phosphorylase [Clostridia bacterium]